MKYTKTLTEFVPLRLSLDQRNQLHQMAANEGLKPSQYIRSVLFSPKNENAA